MTNHEKKEKIEEIINEAKKMVRACGYTCEYHIQDRIDDAYRGMNFATEEGKSVISNHILLLEEAKELAKKLNFDPRKRA